MKILGHEYKINYNDNLEKQRESCAICRFNVLEIYLDSSYPSSRIEEGLLHEVFEAIKYHLDLTDEVLSHPTLSQLAECLYQVIKDNPEYFSIKIKAPTMMAGA